MKHNRCVRKVLTSTLTRAAAADRMRADVVGAGGVTAGVTHASTVRETTKLSRGKQTQAARSERAKLTRHARQTTARHTPAQTTRRKNHQTATKNHQTTARYTPTQTTPTRREKTNRDASTVPKEAFITSETRRLAHTNSATPDTPGASPKCTRHTHDRTSQGTAGRHIYGTRSKHFPSVRVPRLNGHVHRKNEQHGTTGVFYPATPWPHYRVAKIHKQKRSCIGPCFPFIARRIGKRRK